MGMKVPSLQGLLLSLVFMVLIAATFIGMGMAFASRMKDMSGFSLIMNFIIFPIFFLSGAIYPVDRFPEMIQILAYLDPLTYGVDGLRYSLLGMSALPILLDLVVMTGSCLLILGLGAYLFEISEAE